ncbi:NAD(P)-dependent oxidoreductase [Haloechinothrix sp. LS1_15]|uniref:NAD-dependent epimerase/dehydratase family protein n=1 Tax=Haloechinothrix sp. LS1_15 TaxID=2652248 RepID=UPI00294B473D|nr:NAD(P)-dependent oxidoreductase [Haloechinothrix sp. LS1_15]
MTGAGLVGTEVARLAAARGDEVALLDARPGRGYVAWRLGSTPHLIRADVSDPLAVDAAVGGAVPDVIVHTAAVVGRRCYRSPALATRINVAGTATVVEAAIRHGVGRVVLLSSLAVYAWDRLSPHEPVTEAEPVEPRSLYGVTKLAAESVGRSLAGARLPSGRLSVSALRLAGVYGPGQYKGGSAVGAALAGAVAEAVRVGETRVPTMLGGREYLHARDAAVAVLADAATPVEGWRVLNVGSGRAHSADELAEAVAAAVPHATVTVADGERPAQQPVLDCAAARRTIGYRPEVRLADGLRWLARDAAAEDTLAVVT